jgi:two-component system, NarL family, sensor histidine kinase BarA
MDNWKSFQKPIIASLAIALLLIVFGMLSLWQFQSAITPLLNTGNHAALLAHASQVNQIIIAGLLIIALVSGTVVGYLLLPKEDASKPGEQDNTDQSTIAAFSHEIRTPVQNVLLSIEMLQKTKLDPSQQDIMGRMQISSKHILSMINEYLDFEKSKADELTLDVEPFNVSDLIETVMLQLFNKAHSNNLSLSSYIDPRIPPNLFGSPKHLEQVLMNLISNAIKFTNKGGVMVQCLLEKISESEATIAFYVKDTGVGMSAQTCQKLFKPFQQMDNNISREFGGTGLGLSISQAFVQRMGSQIEINSTLGEGSTFSFSIDLRHRDLRNPLSQTFFPKVFPVLKDKSIHIVSASKILSESLELLLKVFGANVTRHHKLPTPALTGDAVFVYEHSAVNQVKLDYDAKVLPKVIVMDVEAPNKQLEFVREYLPLPLKQRHVLAALSNTLEVDFSFLQAPDDHRSASSSEQTPAIIDNDNTTNTDDIQFAGQSILLVDDSDSIRETMKAILTQHNLRVTEAATANEATEMLQLRSYAVVLLDFVLPDGSGLAIAKNTRATDGPNQTTPIITFSAHIDNTTHHPELAACTNARLVKPVDTYQLLTTLKQYVTTDDPLVDIPILEKLALEIKCKSTFEKNIDLFIEETCDRMTRCETQLQKKAFNKLQNECHALVGTAKTFGANKLAACAKELENACITQQREQIPDTFKRCQQLASSTMDALKDAVKNTL